MPAPATQETTGATRIKGPAIITLRGAGSLGHDPYTSGSGGDVGLRIQVPTTQTAYALTIESPDGTVVSAIDATGQFLSMPALMVSTVDLTPADIIDTTDGKLSSTNGQFLVTAPASNQVLEFVSAVLWYKRSTATYGGGGNTTINLGGGGAALSGLVSAANSIGGSGDKIVVFYPLSSAGNAITAATGLTMKSASAYTNPGTAAGTARIFTVYRVHTY